MKTALRPLSFIFVVLILSACAHVDSGMLSKDEISTLIKNSKTHYVEELSKDINIFDNVAVGLGLPLRKYLNSVENVKGRTMLDLGAGSGVLSFIALKNGATKVVATEINKYAVANANYNAELLGFKNRVDVRQVSLDTPGAYSVIGDHERFDLIVSNPPQGKDQPENIYEYSHSDPNLSFFRSIVEGLDNHLTENGKGIFTLYYHTLMHTQQLVSKYGLVVTVLLKTENKNGLYYLVEIKHQNDS